MNNPSQQERAHALRKLFRERIVVIDGAMGTMIQKHKLSEADYRGQRFADWKQDLKGCNDLLVITKPEIIAGIHQQLKAAQPLQRHHPTLQQALHHGVHRGLTPRCARGVPRGLTPWCG